MRKSYCMIVAILFIGISAAGCAPKALEPVLSPTADVLPSPKATPTEAPAVAPLPTQTEQLPSIILDPATDENPYPIPALTGADWAPGDVTDAMLSAFVSRFCYDLFDSCRTLTPPDYSAYIEDNASTHLALRWSEFLIHEVKKSNRKQIIAVHSADAEGGKREDQSDSITYSVMCEVQYSRKDPSVNGCNVDATVTIAKSDGKLRIVAMDLLFDSRYRDLLAKLKKQNAENLTIEQIDKAFEALMK